MANAVKPPCGAILGSSMAFIDGAVLNIAWPALQIALGATISQVQWVGCGRFSPPARPGVVFLPTSAEAGDI
jgi:hypothetical protein